MAELLDLGFKKAPRRVAVKAPARPNLTAIASAYTIHGNQSVAVASAAPAPAKVASGAVGAYVQLSSQPTQGDAKAAAAKATARYGNLFGGRSLVVQPVDLGAKGIRWRVRLPVSTLSQASVICGQIKAAGGDCFATAS